MNRSFSSGWQSRRLLYGMVFGLCLAVWTAWQRPLHAEAPSGPDDFIIVSDDDDAAADEQGDADPAKAEAPEELPTTDENPRAVETEPADAEDEPPARYPETEDTESSANGDEGRQAPSSTGTPAGQPTPAALPATEANRAAAKPTPADPADAAADGEDTSDGNTSSPGRAGQDKPSNVPAGTPNAASAQQPSRMEAEGASFRGVLPAQTTVEELKTAWGPAKEVRNTEAGTQYIYDSKPFKQVIVTVIDQKVDTILIRLDKEFEPKVLAKQLLLDDVEPATIYNPRGQMLGMAFPERGVLFGFVAGTPVQVGQIVLEPINSQPFVTRAEKNVRRNPADALADAKYAIEIDPEYDRAHALYAQVLMQLGEYEKALSAIDKALALQPADAGFRLTRALIQYQLEHFDDAARLAASLAGDADAPPLVAARAEKLRGDLLSRGPERKFDEAIKHHTAAIELAEEVSTSTAGPVRLAAKELLVESHVAIAHDIAWGNWRQKDKVVPRWIDRATSFCDNLIDQDFGEECVRLRLLEQTLNAYAGMKEAPEQTATIDAMTSLARKLGAEASEPRQREVMQWQLGEALASAMLICHQQGKADAATQLGQQALACFEKAGRFRTVSHSTDFLLGRIYYRLGALQAVEHGKHVKAITWYDKAIPLLERPMPLSARPEIGQTGELFVSMAVSYWECEKQEEAIRLTQQGANLMETAVRQFEFPAEALSVPYGNLASMHAGMGDVDEAKRFADLAAKAETRRR